MREIKFRGRNAKHKKWIYGYYFNHNGNPLILQGSIALVGAYCLDPRIQDKDWLVEPESIGQLTGILDKDGKEIYEGDILQDTKRSIKYLVVWNGSQASFELSNPKHRYDNLIFANKTYGRFEVMGDIYKNPELVDQ